METLSDGAREVIREKISEEVRRQYLELTWSWFEKEALPDYLRHREQSLSERYEKRVREMPRSQPDSSKEDLGDEWRRLLDDHLRREEQWLRKLFVKSTEENIEETIRDLCATSQTGELKNILNNLKLSNPLGDVVTGLRKLWAEQFQPT